MGTTQVFQIAGRLADAHGRRVVEAVAAGFATGALGEDLAIDDLFAEEHHQPLRRTHELILARGPAHALGNRQFVQRGLDDAGQQLGRRQAFDVAAEFQLGTAAIDQRQLDTALAGKAQRGLSRLAFGVEGGLNRWAVEIDAVIGLLGRQLFDQYGQATRGGIGLYPRVAQAGFLQALLDAAAKGFGQLAQRLGWQLFGAQLDQEILCTHSAASSLASTSSRRSGVAMGKPSLARACR